MSNDCDKKIEGTDPEKIRERLVARLCDIILVEGDAPNYNGTEDYINSLSSFETSILSQSIDENDKISIREMVTRRIEEYLRKYREKDDKTAPYEFDSGDSYKEYRIFFAKQFGTKTSQKTLPPVFDCVFHCIKESSEQYRLFENFQRIRREDVVKAAEKAAEDATKKAVQDATEKAVQDATKNAEVQAKIAAKFAEDAARTAKDAAENAVDGEMCRVSRTVSETTVTVLGIFAAIILTVVAGFIYSAAMINNMNSANFYRLIAVGSLVGFVCFNLIAVMLRFISKYKHTPKEQENDADKNSAYSKMMFFVSCVLLIIFVVFSVLQFRLSDPLYTTHDVCIAHDLIRL